MYEPAAEASGADRPAKRREFQKLLAKVQASMFAAVLVSGQSRMSREDIFDVMMHWKPCTA
ncbi:hypothetical protein [Thermogutta sp.]|uniref:hypothetical protein n=1 Tax=Thermogutta sp. TaxID=1962930 RepID=UPI00322064D2